MDFEASLQQLEEQIELLKQKAEGGGDAYRQGLTEGLCMALIMLQNRLPVATIEKRTQKANPSPFAKPKRDQLDLF